MNHGYIRQTPKPLAPSILLECTADKDIERLLRNEKIVRHRGKIEATINNAKRAKAMVETEGSLAAFFWRYEPEFVAQQPQKVSTSPESIALSKELKKPLINKRTQRIF